MRRQRRGSRVLAPRLMWPLDAVVPPLPRTLEAVATAREVEHAVRNVVDAAVQLGVAAPKSRVAVVEGKPVEAPCGQAHILELGPAEFPACRCREREPVFQVFLAPGRRLPPRWSERGSPRPGCLPATGPVPPAAVHAGVPRRVPFPRRPRAASPAHSGRRGYGPSRSPPSACGAAAASRPEPSAAGRRTPARGPPRVRSRCGPATGR